MNIDKYIGKSVIVYLNSDIAMIGGVLEGFDFYSTDFLKFIKIFPAKIYFRKQEDKENVPLSEPKEILIPLHSIAFIELIEK